MSRQVRNIRYGRKARLQQQHTSKSACKAIVQYWSNELYTESHDILSPLPPSSSIPSTPYRSSTFSAPPLTIHPSHAAWQQGCREGTCTPPCSVVAQHSTQQSSCVAVWEERERERGRLAGWSRCTWTCIFSGLGWRWLAVSSEMIPGCIIPLGVLYSTSVSLSLSALLSFWGARPGGGCGGREGRST